MAAAVYVGVDPGKSGAIAFLDNETGVAVAQVTPMIPASGSREEFDLPAIRDVFLHAAALAGGPHRLFVTVEKTQPMPPSFPGGSANFARGVGRGWEWMLVALGVPYYLVAPRTWQKAMHAGTPESDTKQRSIMAAQRFFPLVSLLASPRCRVHHDGMAEALLLAAYGQRVHKGDPARVHKGDPAP